MVTQVTISPSFQKKMSKLEQLVGDNLVEKLTSLGHYAVEISPVDTGAFVESWSLRPMGSGASRRLSSEGRLPKDYVEAKDKARQNISKDAERLKDRILNEGGATLRNGSPHAKDVDDKYLTIQRVKNRFR